MSRTPHIREIIVFGPKESFTSPVPAGFFPERESIGAATTLTSKPLRIDYSEYLSVSSIAGGTGWPGTFDIDYEILLSSDGIDESNGEYKNAIWSGMVPLVAGATDDTWTSSLVVDPTEAIRIALTNNGAAITATARTPGDPTSGNGIQLRLKHWS